MQPGEPGKVQSAINVTPLVDVVLVLLIIFMVVTPQMRPGPEVDLPETPKPVEQGSDTSERLVVTIDEHGGLWIDDEQVSPERFGEGLRVVAAAEPNKKVVIQGDARLRFGEVRQAMHEVEEAGFHGVALIAKRAREGEGG
ncbi:MAG TPA: biopolymer transporter ExbD [Candidatus Polarisedimenticolia bacterium]|nr:biopolymer transporter ExbD [Candidatus Polarisedimenticolia bacterium]